MSYPALISCYKFPDEAAWPQRMVDGERQSIAVPPFSTVIEAKERADLVLHGQLQKIRFTAAWGNDWPLWGMPEGPLAPESLGLSGPLRTRLRFWADQWFTAGDEALRNDLEVGVLLPDPWFSEGDELLNDLAVETWAFADVFPYFNRYRITK